MLREFPLWLSRNEPDEYPRGGGLIPGPTQWVKDLVLLLLWLWHRVAAAVLIRPLAEELPYAVGVALKRGGNKSFNIFLEGHTYVLICRHAQGRSEKDLNSHL